MVGNFKISEDFYSIQGEGISSGVPSYFIRLGGCNFICGGPGGKWMKDGKASWWCDTEYVWRNSVERDYHYLINKWQDEGIYDRILDGRIHIIWTGGEPTMVKHQDAISGFMGHLYEIVEGTDNKPFIEIETNGSIYIKDELFNYLDQINCSPKLENSGMNSKRRIRPTALKRIMEHDNYQFKFVISTEDDVKEIIRDFIDPFKIDPRRVVLMPGLDKQENFHERTKFTMEMAKKYGFIGLTRLHVSAWDETTGV